MENTPDPLGGRPKTKLKATPEDQTQAGKPGDSAPRLVRRFEDWTARDRRNWTRIIAMRGHGWSMEQMTTGTRLKRFTVERLLKEYRAAHAPDTEHTPDHRAETPGSPGKP